MNQILSSNGNEHTPPNPPTHKNFSKFFQFQFVFCLVGAIVCSSYYAYLQYDKNRNEALSQEILQRTNITNLYENVDTNYASTRITNEHVYQSGETGFSIVGIIEIKIIGIHYPIINEFRYDLLKIAPCKFLGPSPNEIR